MFDRSFLPEARLEFVVVTDTHYMLDLGTRAVEFESRRRQSERAERELRRIASLETAFVVHLGDLVQEFPESPRFDQAMSEALAQLRRCGVAPRLVAGNHDVGDKPDPTMPTDWVTPAALAAYHERFGPSWSSWDAAGCHFVVLNSQIMNAALPEAEAQRRWVEADLAAHADMPTFIFLHLAPFLRDAEEPGLGHYDNIDEPARGWLVDLVARHNVEMLFAGHSHFMFFNRIGAARSFVVPSTSFTRPGFSELFSSCPPPERGRDDVAKLGFFLVRVQDDGARAHFVRAGEAIAGEQAIVTRLPRDLPGSPLGVTLRHPLAATADVPIAWPSSIRQPVRNDYPLLACLELGVRHLRVPTSDLEDRVQRERLAAVRDEGVQITATWLWSDRLDLADDVARHRDLLSGVELQVPGRALPDDACLRAIHRCSTETTCPVTLSVLMPREVIGGKQHPRTRIGYRASELPALDDHLARAGMGIDRVLCRVDAGDSPWTAMGELPALRPSLSQIGAVDWAVELTEPDEHDQLMRATAAMMAAAHCPGSRLFLEPLVDLDRTMDTPYGLLDRLCNPRPAFRAVRCLNTILFGQPDAWQPVAAPEIGTATSICLRGPSRSLWLIVPNPDQAGVIDISRRDVERIAPDATAARCVRLATATSRHLALDEHLAIRLADPTVLGFDH